MAMPMNDAPTLPRALLPAIVAAALLAGLALLAHGLKPLLNRPVQSLRVDGQLRHVTPRQVAEAAAIPPGMHLFDVDLNAVRNQVQTLPWVGHARVSRVWPGRIAVRVWERTPYALWGDHGLVDQEGAAFTPSPQDLPQGLPHLAGPDGREAEVMRDYQAMAETLAGSVFAPDGLRLDARGSWTLHSAGGIELRLGDDDPRGKIALLQGAVLRTLADKLDQVAYVDLRYSNGFAVGWNNGAGPCPVTAAAVPATPAPDYCGRKDAAHAGNAAAKPPATGAKTTGAKAKAAQAAGGKQHE
jgi:cell division protein FtsQ